MFHLLVGGGWDTFLIFELYGASIGVERFNANLYSGASLR